MKTWKELGWGGRIKLIVLSLLPALVLLAIAQIYADLTISRHTSDENDPITGTPALYRMHIGEAWWGQITETPLNALGFPDKEFVNISPKGNCVHIVFSGDSFTFGDTVDRHRNWFSLVGRAAARQYPDRCIRMFNVGERVTTIQEQRERIRETFGLLQPDLVILQQYQNDLTDLTNPGNVAAAPPEQPGEGVWWNDVVRARVPNAALVRYLTYHAFRFAITRDLHYDILSQWSVLADESHQELAQTLIKHYREMHLDLVSDLRSRGVDFGVIILPSKLDLLAGRSPEEPFFIGLAEEVGAPYLRLFSALDEHRRDYTYQLYDGHLSPAGNVVVAREVYRWLFKRPDAVPFPRLRNAIEGEEPGGVGVVAGSSPPRVTGSGLNAARAGCAVPAAGEHEDPAEDCRQDAEDADAGMRDQETRSWQAR